MFLYMGKGILTWEHYLGLSEWVECNLKGPHKWEAGGSVRKRRGDNGSKSGSDAFCMWRKGHRRRNADGLLKLEKAFCHRSKKPALILAKIHSGLLNSRNVR